LSPTRKPTSKVPSKSPTKRPISLNPTKLPTSSPSKAPTFIYVDQVDLHFILDTSYSMWWRDNDCKLIVPPSDAPPAISACWDLFLNFVRSLSNAMAKQIAGIDKNRELGWKDDFPEVTFPAKGIREFNRV